jgi:hypothetical protein
MSALVGNNSVSVKAKPSVVRKSREVKKSVPVKQAEPKTCKFEIPYWLRGDNGKGSVAYFVYGRYQPGHIGHKVVFNRLVYEAKKGNPSNLPWVDAPQDGKPASNVFVFVSQKQNNKRKKPCSKLEVTGVTACENPLDPNTKVTLLQTQNPKSEPHIHFMEMGNVFSGISLLLDCYNKVVMFVGEDRVDDFDKLKKYYPGRFEVESAGERGWNPDSGNIDGISSSKIRKAAVNIKSFDMGDENYKFVRDKLGVEVGKGLADIIINKINAAYIGATGGRMRKKRTRRKTRKFKNNTRSKRKRKSKSKKKTRKSRKR